MAWSDDAKVFEIKTGVKRRVVSVANDYGGYVWMLTDQGLI